MRRIAVIDGHPDASAMHLDHALAGHYAQAAQEAGADVRRIDIAALEVPVLHKPEDFFSGEAPGSLKEAQRDILWADHLVFVYPLWHGTMPAHMKAFVEQVFRPGFAMDFNGNGRFPKQLFKGKSAAVVVTMGMPAVIYRALFGAHGVKSFERSVLAMCGISPVSEMLLGGAGGNCEGRTRRWFELMKRAAVCDAHPENIRFGRLLRGAVRALILLGVSYVAYIAAASRSDAWFKERKT